MIILRDKQYIESLPDVSFVFYQPYQYAIFARCGIYKVAVKYWVEQGDNMYREYDEAIKVGCIYG